MSVTSYFSLGKTWQQTTTATKWVVFLMLLSACVVQCRICTHMTLEKKVQPQSYMAQCIQSFESRCSWFSVRMCPRNETVPCMKTVNRTITIYRIVEDCCPGYHRNDEEKCIPGGSDKALKDNGEEVTSQDINSSGQGKEDKVTVSYEDLTDEDGADTGRLSEGEDEDEFFLGISHGAYAGIVCGILFLACLALLTGLHYRKKKHRQDKMEIFKVQQDASQKQQMIPMEKIDDAPAVNT